MITKILNSIRKWRNTPMDEQPSPEHEEMFDEHGVRYWLASTTDKQGRINHFGLVHQGEDVACEDYIYVVNLTWDLPDVLYLDEICLPPEHRGAGIGSQFLFRVITLAKEQGVRSIQGEITGEDAENTPGLLDWYERYGFRVKPYQDPSHPRFVHSIVLDLP